MFFMVGDPLIFLWQRNNRPMYPDLIFAAVAGKKNTILHTAERVNQKLPTFYF
jgi:hypothetical protein